MPNPTAYPLGAPIVNGSKLTIDTMLKQPGRITKRLSDLILQNFIAGEVFTPSGASTESGSIIYDQVTINDLYGKRDVEQRGPSDEYPIIYADRGDPKTAKSEDYGGKFWMSDEAITRNNTATFNNDVTVIANTITRKFETLLVATLEAAIAAVPGGAGVVPANDWSAVELTGTNPTPTKERPVSDLANVQLAADVEELGVQYDLWIVNPVQKATLIGIYGSEWAAILAGMGIRIKSSNRVANGTAYAVHAGQVGFLDFEKQLTTETWREEATRRNWVQSYAMPIMGVTNPYSVKKITGLNG